MADLLATLEQNGNVAQALSALSGIKVYPRSVIQDGGSLFFLGRDDLEHRLGLLMTQPEQHFRLTTQPLEVRGMRLTLGLGEASPENALALRDRLAFCAPMRIGVYKSAGLGDRLGIATPGLIRAVRNVQGIAPILAQQSIREMERTQRTPRQVLDDATWGVFQEGWREGYGADADHLKTQADIDLCTTSGYVNYTFDPREQVDNAPETDPLALLQEKFAALPWAGLETTAADTRRLYLDRPWDLGTGEPLTLNEEQLLRAACKYGPALVHLVAMYRYLLSKLAGRPFRLEISVDETDTPTKPEEHFYVASELKRLGVNWVSLAPRYVGRFEKGVDYIGDLAVFEREFARHVAIARALGPYKLSLHSGSDKFSIYPIVARLAGPLVHLKTAGTTYLEELRALASVDPELFREILGFAIAHYEEERVSYVISAQVSRMIAPGAVDDERLPSVMDQFDTRQALHVVFGPVVTARDEEGRYLFRDELFAALAANEEAHYQAIETHMTRHLQPFSD